MSTFLSNYIGLAGPAVLASLLTTSVAYVLLGGRDFAVPKGLLWKVAGTGVLAAVLTSVVLALFGVASSQVPLAVGVLVGLCAAFFMRDRPASN